jgi:hypothetical protein
MNNENSAEIKFRRPSSEHIDILEGIHTGYSRGYNPRNQGEEEQIRQECNRYGSIGGNRL